MPGGGYLAAMPLDGISEIDRAVPSPPSEETLAELEDGRRAVRNASLWIGAGGLITAGTYYFATGESYFILWGPIVFGLFSLLAALNVYRVIPGANIASIAPFLAICALGIGSAGAVAYSEASAAALMADADVLSETFNRADGAIEEAWGLYDGVVQRGGEWTERDSEDLRRAARLIEEAAVIIESAEVSADLVWYTAELSAILRERAVLMDRLAAQPVGAALDAIEAEHLRLDARADELGARLEAWLVSKGIDPG